VAGAGKEGTTDPTTLTYDLALDEALTQGWIDGQTGRRDERTYRTRFTPRRARSQWSARNVGIVSRLMSEGRMQPAGLSQVDQAKTDGRWEAAYAARQVWRCPQTWIGADRGPQARAMFRDPHQPEPLCGAVPDRQREGARRPAHAGSGSSSTFAGPRRDHLSAEACPSPADGCLPGRQKPGTLRKNILPAPRLLPEESAR